MNARLPAFSLPTANPCADAERWENEQEAADEFAQEAERQAPVIVLSQLSGATKPGDWFEERVHTSVSWSPDEILNDALAMDDDTKNAYAELMTSPHAQKLRQCMAAWFGRDHALAIYTEHVSAGG